MCWRIGARRSELPRTDPPANVERRGRPHSSRLRGLGDRDHGAERDGSWSRERAGTVVLPGLLALHLLQLFLSARSWQCVLPPGPALLRLYRLRITREGIDSMLP